ncbi:hypothetical protein AKJ09_07736 [Labilithrix luteola]|uniref:Tryptophan synthase alpha chain n=1 Tax=Labilithrix luteola TaxID=1391654 RepID=A0A0K1Q5Q7_9BACT|nr:hypothetical protein [Labilithrix luteola]AKV01073.1 hypothetical protein AKJ09_07736 [Labilithrix luteola]
MLNRHRHGASVAAALVGLVSLAACGSQTVSFSTTASEAPPVPFAPADDAGDADVVRPEVTKLCIATTCPAPYETCGGSYRCGTNLSTDSKNCGECGLECPVDFGYMNMTSTCVNGMCEPLCAKKPVWGGFNAFADCNKFIEDGCEVSLSTDPKNCGACGNECADGVRCIDGKCGCDPGMVDCNGACIDVRHDDNNCGACGNVCMTSPDAGPPPTNMVYGCVDNKCGQPKCINAWGDRWADCDSDLGNGCEVYIGANVSLIDPNNCGACGNQCAPGKVCTTLGLSQTPVCACTKANETQCGSIDIGDLGCFDLLNDAANCGTCFNICRSDPEAHTIGACRKGACELDCLPGWGDCDGDPDNGCEANLKASDANCGACGNRCDTQAGQPCVGGQCATTECDAGRGPQ